MEITVGITCYNEGGNIGYLLSDLRGQTLREGFRIRSVLVVASGCTDGTVEAVKKFSELDGRVRLVKEKKRNGKPSAINLILEQAEGEVLVLLGGDIRLAGSGFINQLIEPFAEERVGVVGCRPIPLNSPTSRAGYLGHVIWETHDKMLKTQIEYGLAKHVGEAFAIRRGALESIPKDVINDDAYLVLKAQEKGFSVVYERGAVVYIQTPEEIQELLRQRARIIKGYSQLKGQYGLSPDVLDVLFTKKPLIALKILLRQTLDLLNRRALRLAWLLQIPIIELFAHLLAAADRRITNLWIPAHSARKGLGGFSGRPSALGFSVGLGDKEAR